MVKYLLWSVFKSYKRLLSIVFCTCLKGSGSKFAQQILILFFFFPTSTRNIKKNTYTVYDSHI